MRAGVILLDDPGTLDEALAHFEQARAIFDELGMAPRAYEAYDNIDAFEAHCRSTHLPSFKNAFKNMIVAERPLRRGSRGHMAT